jgi:hypothetical protein
MGAHFGIGNWAGLDVVFRISYFEIGNRQTWEIKEANGHVLFFQNAKI